MSLVESRSHIIHAIPSEKMTAKNDLQTEYIYNSVGVIEAHYYIAILPAIAHKNTEILLSPKSQKSHLLTTL